MLRYEFITGKSKSTEKEYTILRMHFLLKDGEVYVLDKFLTKEEVRLLKFIASNEEISNYLQNQNAF